MENGVQYAHFPYSGALHLWRRSRVTGEKVPEMGTQMGLPSVSRGVKESQRSRVAVTSAPSAVAASSYAAWPGPCHFVMPFNVLVVTQAMLLLLGFLTVSDRSLDCRVTGHAVTGQPSLPFTSANR